MEWRYVDDWYDIDVYDEVQSVYDIIVLMTKYCLT